MKNDGQFKMITPPKKTAVPNDVLLSDVQKGLISLGIVNGAALAISQKKGFWAIIGYMWLGSMAGGGIGYLFRSMNERKKEEQNERK